MADEIKLQEFTYSAVGTNGDSELVNVYGSYSAGCLEYARRYGVECFHHHWPTGQIIMAGAAPVRRDCERVIAVKP
jgi:hypothetical protein